LSATLFRSKFYFNFYRKNMATIIIFAISFMGLSLTIVYKVFEIRVRKIHFLSNLFAKGDRKIHELWKLLELKYFRYKKIAHIFIFDFVPSYLYELLVRMKDHVSKKYYQAGDGFRGRRILKSTGSVSFFLEKLAEEKPRADIRNTR